MPTLIALLLLVDRAKNIHWPCDFCVTFAYVDTVSEPDHLLLWKGLFQIHLKNQQFEWRSLILKYSSTIGCVLFDAYGVTYGRLALPGTP